MTIRDNIEKREHLHLADNAAFSDMSKGRPCPQETDENDVRTNFQRDTDRIIHCKSFRRLMHKTQVFLQPEGDHYRTRMTHTIEVARIARTITRALQLNEDLAEAIAMGHDLGHTPFGHAGEGALSECIGKPFRHNEQSLRVVDILELDGAGLNLSHEVRMGILGHTGEFVPETMEGQIVRFSDQIAYVNHDIDDAMRAGVLCDRDIPRSIAYILGENHSHRIDTLVWDLIRTSAQEKKIGLSDPVAQALRELRSLMFEKVYFNPVVKGEESKAKDMLKRLYDYYYNHPEMLPEDFQPQMSFDGMERTVCDYIAGMTDKYAVDKFTELFIPAGWHIRG